MARWVFGIGRYDRKAKMVMNHTVTVYAKSQNQAFIKAQKLAGKHNDMYLKEIEETPNDNND